MTLKLNGSTAGSVSLDAPASTTSNADIAFKLPVADGTNGQAITTDGSGNLSFATAGNASSIQVLEQFFSPCDGSVIATSAGNLTLPNVTAYQQMTTSMADIVGSQISYVPPTGTTQVIYMFHFVQGSDGDNDSIFSTKLLIDGSTINYSKFTQRGGNAHFDTLHSFQFGINIGGTASTNTGRVASWTSAKTLKMQGAEYSGSHETQVHRVQNFGYSNTPMVFRMPSIGITAIGSV